MVIQGHDVSDAEDSSDTEPVIAASGVAGVRPSLIRSAKTILIWGTLWMLPVAVLLLFAGRGDVFTELAIFFSKLATVTFGGAYAVLA